MPATAASAVIWSALVVNGSAAKTPKRTRSEPIIRRRRESRSISGPTRIPMTKVGRRSAIRSAATQADDSVLVQTSTSSATRASHVPAPEPRVAKKRRRKLGSRPRSPSWVPAERGRPIGSRTVTPLSALKRGVFWPCLCRRARKHAFERSCEQLVLVGCAHGDADGAGRAETVRRPDDHALAQELLEERPRVVTHLHEDEVRHGRSDRLEPVLAQDRFQLRCAPRRWRDGAARAPAPSRGSPARPPGPGS